MQAAAIKIRRTASSLLSKSPPHRDAAQARTWLEHDGVHGRARPAVLRLRAAETRGCPRLVCPQQPTEQRPDRSTQETAHTSRFATLAEDADGFLFGIRTAAGVSRRFARR